MEDQVVEHAKVFDKRELYRKFVDLGDDGKPRNRDFHGLKQRAFTMWLRRWAEYRPEYAGYKEWRSSGTDNIVFFHNQPVPGSLFSGATIFPGERSSACVAMAEGEDLPF